jgi:hypothetical protein
LGIVLLSNDKEQIAVLVAGVSSFGTRYTDMELLFVVALTYS